MKIAMVGLKGVPATYGGVERHVEELSARLAARGHQVTIYCRRHYTERRGEYRGARLRVLPSLNTVGLDTITHTTLATADALLRGFDVIHFHSIGPAALSFLPRVFRPGRAVVATVHGLDWRRRKWGGFARWWLRRGEWAARTFPHRTIVVSRDLQTYFHEHGAETVWIPNGVEEPVSAPMSELAPVGLFAPGFIFWMGRFVPEKRVEELIRAYRKIPDAPPLALAGELDENDEYVSMLRAEAAGDARIHFVGGLYGPAKAAALSHARIFVLPSELEGFPIVLLEAMRHGRAVLASDIPANLEAVRPDINGYAFRMGEVESLQAKLMWMLTHPVEITRAGAQAAQDAKAYDWDIIAGQTEEVYRAAAGGVPASP